MTWTGTVLGCGIYLLLGRWLVGTRWEGRHAAFALLNLAAIFAFVGRDKGIVFATLLIAANLLLLLTHYIALSLWSHRAGWLTWVAFLIPIAALAVVRYVPIGVFGVFSGKLHDHLARHPEVDLASRFLGLSYLAFRTSHLVLQIRNGVLPKPGFCEYVGFALFAPTLLVGPISPYSEHRRAFGGTDRPQIPVGRALLRVLVGAVKYKFFGPLLSQLTYSELLLDGHPHPWLDLPVAAVAFYLFLYCNFSGFCDMAIGAAGLMGISVAENFDSPFAARNMKEFWNRWHITLSQYMRDVVFSPLSKTLVRLFGSGQANQAVAVSILVVFLLMGVWHGVGWNYALFGVAQALGVVTTHYYTIMLKKLLGKEGFAAYNRNPIIYAVGVMLTFSFYACTLFLFANDSEAMKQILLMVGGK